jgi:hypothetical protein
MSLWLLDTLTLIVANGRRRQIRPVLASVRSNSDGLVGECGTASVVDDDSASSSGVVAIR